MWSFMLTTNPFANAALLHIFNRKYISVFDLLCKLILFSVNNILLVTTKTNNKTIWVETPSTPFSKLAPLAFVLRPSCRDLAFFFFQPGNAKSLHCLVFLPQGFILILEKKQKTASPRRSGSDHFVIASIHVMFKCHLWHASKYGKCFVKSRTYFDLS